MLQKNPLSACSRTRVNHIAFGILKHILCQNSTLVSPADLRRHREKDHLVSGVFGFLKCIQISLRRRLRGFGKFFFFALQTVKLFFRQADVFIINCFTKGHRNGNTGYPVFFVVLSFHIGCRIRYQAYHMVFSLTFVMINPYGLSFIISYSRSFHKRKSL